MNDEHDLSTTEEQLQSIIATLASDMPPGLGEAFAATSLLAWQLHDESDRGAALYVSSYVEDRLSNLLISFLIDETPAVKSLFEPNSPLSSFSSKINMAYCLGLISKYVKDDLNIIRRIRNDFAHSPVRLTFEDKVLVSRVRAFSWNPGKLSSLSVRDAYSTHCLDLVYILTIGALKTEHKLTRDEENPPQNSSEYTERFLEVVNKNGVRLKKEDLIE